MKPQLYRIAQGGIHPIHERSNHFRTYESFQEAKAELLKAHYAILNEITELWIDGCCTCFLVAPCGYCEDMAWEEKGLEYEIGDEERR